MWDVTLLNQWFAPVDRDLILSIPLSWRALNDRLVWHFHKKGIFTTNSAYFVARDVALGLVLAPPAPIDPYKKLWPAIWHAKVPPKVALHAWKCCVNILPTRNCLSSKGYMGDMTCLLCNNGLENGVHLFTECSYAKEVWAATGLPMPTAVITDLKDWLLSLVSLLSKEHFAQVLMGMWTVWKNRNSQLWEGTKKHPIEANMVAMCWLTEFSKENVNEKAPSVQRREWIAPSAGWLKCYSDGSFISSTKQRGMGIVIRDHAGTFKVATLRQLDQVVSPFHAELLALYEGMKMSQSLHYDRVEFETDCMLLVHALKQEELDYSTLGFILEEVKELLRRHVHYIVHYAPRDANKMAHTLASRSLCHNDSQMWFVTAPEFLRDAILNECSR